ncbi:MAG: PrgI family protein [Candidatus Saccharibacteria bacterium]|nr:PrgI family protein [Candidatus Saccharibacteria bacterium]
MAQYKVPQDVEAEDKLLGPFTFRQFVYLMIIGGLIGLGVLFWGIFPPLIIVLVPPILLLGALALPLKKDQPMETYLSAVVSFYLKPHTRIWEPGEPESTIMITAPKQTEEKRTKDLDQDEAIHRLSFLADIIDTEGYAIKGATPNSGVKEEIYAEANDTLDMFEDPTSSNTSINQTLQDSAASRHTAAINQMRAAIENNSHLATQATIQTSHEAQPQPIVAAPAPTQVTQTAAQTPQPPVLPENPTIAEQVEPVSQPVAPVAPTAPQEDIAENPLNDAAIKANDAIIKPDSMVAEIEAEKANAAAEAVAKREAERKELVEQTDPNLLDLANNKDFSIETIAKQAKRIKEKKDDEVYISLH